MSTRQEGYYCVKTSESNWIIALWVEQDNWWLWIDKQFGIVCSSMQRIDGKYISIEEINETRILSPDESGHTFAGVWNTEQGPKDIYIDLPSEVSLERYINAIQNAGPYRPSPEEQANELIRKINGPTH